jgi:subfamily B ATP-binding cassette protein MsbA
MSRHAYDVTERRRCGDQCADVADQGFLVHHRPDGLAALPELEADADHAQSVVPFIAFVVRLFQQATAQRCPRFAAGIDGQDHPGAAGDHRRPQGGQDFWRPEPTRKSASYKSVREQRRFAMRCDHGFSQPHKARLFSSLLRLGVAIIMGVALKQAADDQTSVGSFVSFITAMLMLMAPLRRI